MLSQWHRVSRTIVDIQLFCFFYQFFHLSSFFIFFIHVSFTFHLFFIYFSFIFHFRSSDFHFSWSFSHFMSHFSYFDVDIAITLRWINDQHFWRTEKTRFSIKSHQVTSSHKNWTFHDIIKKFRVFFNFSSKSVFFCRNCNLLSIMTTNSKYDRCVWTSKNSTINRFCDNWNFETSKIKFNFEMFVIIVTTKNKREFMLFENLTMNKSSIWSIEWSWNLMKSFMKNENRCFAKLMLIIKKHQNDYRNRTHLKIKTIFLHHWNDCISKVTTFVML